MLVSISRGDECWSVLVEVMNAGLYLYGNGECWSLLVVMVNAGLY